MVNLGVNVEELREAAAAADQGPPVRLWAVLLELAGVAGLENLPDPEVVEIVRDGLVAEPVLALEFRHADDAIRWCDWFGTGYYRCASKDSLSLTAVASQDRRIWHGYVIQIASWGGPRRGAGS